MRSSFLILSVVAILLALNVGARPASADSAVSAGTNLLHELPGVINAIPGASNWLQSNLPAGATNFLHKLTNNSKTNFLSSPSNLFPSLSNWVHTNAAGGTNSLVHVSNWFGTNVSANGTNTFQEFTNWLGTNYSRTLTNIPANQRGTNLPPGLSNIISSNLPHSFTNESQLNPPHIHSTNHP